jgi:hypothetical protein
MAQYRVVDGNSIAWEYRAGMSRDRKPRNVSRKTYRDQRCGLLTSGLR